MKTASILALVGLVGVFLFSDPLTAQRTTPTIAVHDNYFQPAILHVMPGETVRWLNQGKHTHTVTLPDGQDYVFQPGASIDLRFYTDGTLRYRCRLHSLVRMEGTVLVGAGR